MVRRVPEVLGRGLGPKAATVQSAPVDRSALVRPGSAPVWGSRETVRNTGGEAPGSATTLPWPRLSALRHSPAPGNARAFRAPPHTACRPLIDRQGPRRPITRDSLPGSVGDKTASSGSPALRLPAQPLPSTPSSPTLPSAPPASPPTGTAPTHPPFTVRPPRHPGAPTKTRPCPVEPV